MKANVARIRATRERLVEGCRSLGLESLPSAEGFVFVRIGSSERAAAAYQHLRDAGILVRYFALRLLDDGLRITVITDDEIDALFAHRADSRRGPPTTARRASLLVQRVEVIGPRLEPGLGQLGVFVPRTG